MASLWASGSSLPLKTSISAPGSSSPWRNQSSRRRVASAIPIIVHINHRRHGWQSARHAQATAGLGSRHTLVSTTTMATARGAVAGRTDGPGLASGDRGDDLVLLGFRIELAAVEDMYAVDLLRDGAAGGAGFAQDALSLLNRGACLFGIGGAPLHDLMAAAIGDDDASHDGLLSRVNREEWGCPAGVRRGGGSAGRRNGSAGDLHAMHPARLPLYSCGSRRARGLIVRSPVTTGVAVRPDIR